MYQFTIVVNAIATFMKTKMVLKLKHGFDFDIGEICHPPFLHL